MNVMNISPAVAVVRCGDAKQFANTQSFNCKPAFAGDPDKAGRGRFSINENHKGY